MPRQKPRLNFTVVHFGDLKRAEAENIVSIADRVQSAFGFDMYPEKLEFDRVRYKLSNGGYDLEAAAKESLKRLKWPRPLILLTSAPFSDPDYGSESDYFFFNGMDLNNDDVALISTYVWDHLPGKRRLQPYLLYQFAEMALGRVMEIPVHDETRGCVCDYCNEPGDIDLGFERGPFCSHCEQHIEHELRFGTLSCEEIAGIRRIYNRAVERRECFVAMAFRKELKPVYAAISKILREEGWTVIRADEMERPRSITDAIMQAIYTSDLVVADLTGNNENVYYELGAAHALGCDVVIITQEESVPFDIKTERTVFYKNSSRGIAGLCEAIKKLARK